jgi:hypothetical protein
MAIKHDVIDVSVSQQILWIGSDAYPLKGITRVGSRTWVPRRAYLVWEFVKSVVGWWFTGFLVAAGVAVLRSSLLIPADSMLNQLVPLVFAALVVVTVIKAVRLASWLRFTFHKLDIETASSSTTALVSRDPSVVRDLVARITAAINNPAAEFHMRVDNFHLGDNINQHGDNSVVNK